MTKGGASTSNSHLVESLARVKQIQTPTTKLGLSTTSNGWSSLTTLGSNSQSFGVP